jgi:hypothetical protein
MEQGLAMGADFDCFFSSKSYISSTYTMEWCIFTT